MRWFDCHPFFPGPGEKCGFSFRAFEPEPGVEQTDALKQSLEPRIRTSAAKDVADFPTRLGHAFIGEPICEPTAGIEVVLVRYGPIVVGNGRHGRSSINERSAMLLARYRVVAGHALAAPVQEVSKMGLVFVVDQEFQSLASPAANSSHSSSVHHSASSPLQVSP